LAGHRVCQTIPCVKLSLTTINTYKILELADDFPLERWRQFLSSSEEKREPERSFSGGTYLEFARGRIISCPESWRPGTACKRELPEESEREQGSRKISNREAIFRSSRKRFSKPDHFLIGSVEEVQDGTALREVKSLKRHDAN
jgi:hypothetical protein